MTVILHDYFLQVVDEASMQEALLEVGAVDEFGNPTKTMSVDVLGTWYKQVGGTQDAPVVEPVPGWHFNVRSLTEITWPDYVSVATPSTPWRVWA